MSEYLYSEEFQKRVGVIRELAKQSEEFYNWIAQTVPENKVEIEAQKDFSYAFDEVATIVGYDLKVGPPREIFYDEPARMVGAAIGLDPLQSVYLYPTYPLRLWKKLFLLNEEIEKFGVTPYKAGSKGLKANRIILGKTSLKSAKILIEQSVVTKNPIVPNAVLDIAIITEMARQWLSGELDSISIREEFYNGSISPDHLREIAIDGLARYIFNVIPGFD